MKKQKGFALIELLLVIVIILFLWYILAKVVFKGANVDKNTQKKLAEHGIKTTDYPGMVQNAKDTVEKYNKRLAEQEKQFKTEEKSEK